MSYLAKLFGLALLLLAAWLVGAGYSFYCKKRLKQTEQFLSLILHVRKRIEIFMATQKNLLCGYESDALSRFVMAATEKGSLYEAFKEVRGGLCVSEELKGRLSEFFSEFGKNYREAEMKRTELFCAELREELKKEEERTPVRIKIAYTLLFAAAGSLLIILL